MILCGCDMSLDVKMPKKDKIYEWYQEGVISLYGRWPSCWHAISHNTLDILIRAILLSRNRNIPELNQVKKGLLQDYKHRCKKILWRDNSQIIWKLKLCQRTRALVSQNCMMSSPHFPLYICSSLYFHTN